MSESKSLTADPRYADAVRALTELGYTQEQIGEKLNIPEVTVSIICRLNAIKRKSKYKDPEKEYRENMGKIFQRAYDEGLTDKQIAARAQESTEKVRAWRQRKSLRENRKYTMCPAYDCKYHAKKYGEDQGFEHGCDYACVTALTRTGQLTKEELHKFPCRLYDKGEKLRAKPEPIVLKGSKPRKTKYAWDAAERMYDAGATDAEIAEAFECSIKTVQHHRRGWGESNRPKPKTKYDWEKAYALYTEGKTNAEIAEEIGATIHTVEKKKHEWRKNGK